MKLLTIILLFLLTTLFAKAELAVKVASTNAGTKAIITLNMKNTFDKDVESARAQVFLTDESGKVVGQNVQWVIGGKKDRLPLPSGASSEFNFVIQSSKPYKTVKVSFIRVILEGGKTVDVKTGVTIEESGKEAK